MIGIHLSPKFKAAPSSRVWLEEALAPTPQQDSYRALISVLRGHPPEDKLKLSVLAWEPGRERVNVTVADVLRPCLEINGSDDLELFFRKYGALFTGRSKPLSEALAELEMVQLLILLKGATKQLKPGMPPLVAHIRNQILEPLSVAATRWPQRKRFKLFVLDGRTLFVPAMAGDWPVFTVPDPQPYTRDEVIAWAQQALMVNAARRLSSALAIGVNAKKDGTMVLQAKARDMLGFILAGYMFAGKPRRCKCGCGNWVTGRGAYYGNHGRKVMQTGEKQKVLSFWRTRKKRGKISPEQYERIKSEVNREWNDKMARDELMAVAERVLRNKDQR